MPQILLSRPWLLRPAIRRLFAITPRRQVLVLGSEEGRRDHHGTLRCVFEFLSVDPGVRIEPAMIHARTYETPLPTEVKGRELNSVLPRRHPRPRTDARLGPI